MDIIAVIPARGGSKRIPKKNIRLFYDKPIIAYTIEAAIDSNIFSKVIVSTDDPEIAIISKNYGAEIPFLRDSSIADEFTPVSLVTLDVLNRLELQGTTVKTVAQLMANCPLRDTNDIIQSYEHFTQMNANSQISVTRYGWLNPWWAMTLDKSNKLIPVFQDQMKKRSQDLPELFCPSGAVWWIKSDTLKREKTFHCLNRIGWELPWTHAIDIDTEEDWKMAEFIMKWSSELQ